MKHLSRRGLLKGALAIGGAAAGSRIIGPWVRDAEAAVEPSHFVHIFFHGGLNAFFAGCAQQLRGQFSVTDTNIMPVGNGVVLMGMSERTSRQAITQVARIAAMEWAADGTLAKKDVFDQGRKHTTQTVHHGGDVKKFSGQFLEPELQAKQLDDWWKGEMATYASTGKPIKHGGYTAWHPNGQLRMKGEYKYDMPVGTFTWWYANGQKSLEGDYAEGKQEGEWSWWHENGQRSIRGYFAAGNPEGKWTWWNKEGKVAQSGDFSDEKGQIVVTPVTPMPVEQAQTPQKAIKPARR